MLKNEINENLFFISTPLDFEKLAMAEFREKFQNYFAKAPPKTILDTGGFSFSAPLLEGLALNHLLKIPNRILLRIANFKCRDYPKLYNKICKIRWVDFITNNNIHANISATSSRLMHTKKIEKALLEGIACYFKANPPSKKAQAQTQAAGQQEIFVRIHNDDCTISINSSGENLHKRFYRQFTAEAPIRENLAAGLIYKLLSPLDKSQHYNFIDPMCGSGTSICEALFFCEINDKRPFAYRGLPIVSDKNISLANECCLAFSFSSLHGTDIQKKTVECAIKNFSLLNADGRFQNVTFQKEDLFAVNMTPPISGHNIVFVNPPYNERLQVNESNLQNYFDSIVKTVIEKFHPQRAAIIFPAEYQLPPVINYLHEKLRFKNGGIKTICHFLTMKN
ncbi:MAG: hypothetical protein A2504_01215 [Bdellovibrionales bacterium RIFOXYD12_FULL_39_22]|nr:MAG: hypothetical protein A2385_02105 [Bdellovibrionales bacterium RIFOXYB1_FULL_39_21]OFZ42727.1 MAG: hypothetical protein A2485_10290 [Bdellovibrionales bacterium RIFOXYC12_FULL_39_17]OFZ47286.1 MAG: hypothetical protein A2404_14895 [Bdellovibrionales bacterium RIFOXYC1_FULL_39_130]OFZ68494.1 MAG: hypothetical protein A2451_08575 [Bdellovibrionales bacterium RIFOXYC2_FULL_39_8]OFZ75452.1 MAG: hypothetical protein A2560_04165 [Bdellovibrionales bacterium RIFOXYD1_FULL_39_84]OFZ93406.1 MAG: